jgi:hypothetical protein
MSSVTINDRLSITLTEFILPEFQENFFVVSQKPMLRYLGMELNEGSHKSGSSEKPRVERIKQVERIGSGYKFEIVHNHTPFGGGTFAQAISTPLRPGKFVGARSNGLVKFITQSMQIPAQVIEASRSPEFSVTNELVQNMMGALHVMHSEINRMLFSPTDHAIAYVDGAVNNSTSFTVQTNTSGTNERPPSLHLQVGDVLLIGTVAEIEAGTAEEVTVSAVTGETTFTSEDAETCADNDLIVRADVYDSGGSVYTDLTSMKSLVNNTGTVQGVNKATNAWFQSKVTSVGGALALSHVDNLAIATRRYSKNPEASFLVGNSTQWRRYGALLTTTKQLDNNTFSGNLAGGLTGLKVYTPDGSLPFFIDDDVEDGVIYLIDPNGYKWFSFREFGPADDSLAMNGYAGQRTPNTLDYEFALWVGGQIGQVNARSSGVLTGITS